MRFDSLNSHFAYGFCSLSPFERAAAETLMKVRKSYISETASRKTGQNVIYSAPLSLTAQNSGCPNPGKSDIIMITVDAV